MDVSAELLRRCEIFHDLPPEVVDRLAALLEPGIHAATARAVDELEVLELDADKVRTALSNDAPAAMRLFAQVARLMVRRLRYAVARRAGWDLVYRPGATRTEHDLLGEREVPADARYGIQTLRAVENFPITGIRLAHFPHLVRALAMVEGSIALVTALVPALGYERASAIAKEALASGRGVREIVRSSGDLDDAELDRLLSPEAMTRPRTVDAIGRNHGGGTGRRRG